MVASDSQAYWWFEVVDLSRKLFLSAVIVFVQEGSVEQVLLALSVWYVEIDSHILVSISGP